MVSRLNTDNVCILLVHISRYDSLTGVPSTHKDISYEKASVLFNAATLSSQIGTRQDRTSGDGLDIATEHYLSAAGIFQYILDNFSDLPGRDLDYDTLQLLVQLMLAQARETSFQKMELFFDEENGGFDLCLELGQEAADVSLVYDALLETAGLAKYQVPYSWMCIVRVKQRHYMALADYYVATAFLGIERKGERDIKKLGALYEEDAGFVNAQSTEGEINHLGNFDLLLKLCILNNVLRKGSLKRSIVD